MADKKFVILFSAIIVLALISIGNLVYIFLIRPPQDLNQRGLAALSGNNTGQIQQNANVNSSIMPSPESDLVSCEKMSDLSQLDAEYFKNLKIGNNDGADYIEKYLICESLRSSEPTKCSLLKNDTMKTDNFSRCVIESSIISLTYNKCTKESLDKCYADNLIDDNDCNIICDMISSKNSSVCESRIDDKFFYSSCQSITFDDPKKCANYGNKSEQEKCADIFNEIKYLKTRDRAYFDKLSQERKLYVSAMENKDTTCDSFFSDIIKKDCME